MKAILFNLFFIVDHFIYSSFPFHITTTTFHLIQTLITSCLNSSYNTPILQLSLAISLLLESFLFMSQSHVYISQSNFTTTLGPIRSCHFEHKDNIAIPRIRILYCLIWHSRAFYNLAPSYISRFMSYYLLKICSVSDWTAFWPQICARLSSILPSFMILSMFGMSLCVALFYDWLFFIYLS